MDYSTIYQKDANRYMVQAMNLYVYGKRDIKINTKFNFGLFYLRAKLFKDESNRADGIIKALYNSFNVYFSSVTDVMKIVINLDQEYFEITPQIKLYKQTDTI